MSISSLGWEAKHFTHVFCSACGASMPRLDESRGIAIVPMGSLDDDPGVRPQRHIFAVSRAPWDEIHDNLPVFSGPPDSIQRPHQLPRPCRPACGQPAMCRFFLMTNGHSPMRPSRCCLRNQRDDPGEVAAGHCCSISSGDDAGNPAVGSSCGVIRSGKSIVCFVGIHLGNGQVFFWQSAFADENRRAVLQVSRDLLAELVNVELRFVAKVAELPQHQWRSV